MRNAQDTPRPLKDGARMDTSIAGAYRRRLLDTERTISSTATAARIAEPIVTALSAAADVAAVKIAEATGKTPEAVRAQLACLVQLLTAVVSGEADECREFEADDVRHFVDAYRSDFLAHLERVERVDGAMLVRVLRKMEDVVHARHATSTGKFMARLSGSESADAVVAIAHDIRSPLSSILFLVDTIRRGRGGKLAPVQERQLGLIYGAALGLNTLASDLMDAARGERLVDGQPVPFSITETMMAVQAIVQPLGEEKGLPLHVSFPNVDGRIGYPAAIHRVLLNLTANALRYTDTGFVSFGCTELSPTRVEFWIEDTGRGIPDKVLAMLFDGFRPGVVGLRFSSAGLGLAIVRTLLDAMDSTLKVTTALERGTRFSFELELPPA
jgi:signal transduction histidine kinase